MFQHEGLHQIFVGHDSLVSNLLLLAENLLSCILSKVEDLIHYHLRQDYPTLYLPPCSGRNVLLQIVKTYSNLFHIVQKRP